MIYFLDQGDLLKELLISIYMLLLREAKSTGLYR